MYRNPWDEFNYQKLEMCYRNGDGYIHRDYLIFDDQPLISEENAEVWSDYLSNLLKKTLTVEVMESEEFKQIVSSQF